MNRSCRAPESPHLPIFNLLIVYQQLALLKRAIRVASRCFFESGQPFLSVFSEQIFGNYLLRRRLPGLFDRDSGRSVAPCNKGHQEQDFLWLKI